MLQSAQLVIGTSAQEGMFGVKTACWCMPMA